METIILAAGKGSRMKDTISKVLVDVEGVPMIRRIVDACMNQHVNQRIVIVGNNANLVQNVLKNDVKEEFRVPQNTSTTRVEIFTCYINHLPDNCLAHGGYSVKMCWINIQWHSKKPD